MMTSTATIMLLAILACAFADYFAGSTPGVSGHAAVTLTAITRIPVLQE